jgi:uncharacterized cupredoxin-like copper-binding protein
MNIAKAVLAATLASLPVAASAHGDAHKPSHASAARPMVETVFGRTGDPKRANRTVRIDMSDKMRFDPGAIEVGQGDTVRFLVRNSGAVMHEMVLGTMTGLKEHSELMRKHPGMEHDEPYMAHVAPGQTVEIVWQFTERGEYYYGCLIPGHFEAGMVGKLTVR